MRNSITFGALALFTLAGAGQSPRGASSVVPPADSAERARALHVLNRLTYGPRPGDVDRVVAMGVDQFIDQQLHPEKIGNQALDERLASYRVLRISRDELA